MPLFGKINPVEQRRQELAALQAEIARQEAALQDQLHSLKNPEKERIYQHVPDSQQPAQIRKNRDLAIHRRQARNQFLIMAVPLIIGLMILWHLCKKIF